MKHFFFIIASFFAMANALCQTASFTSDVTSGCIPLIVQFDGTASSGSGTLIYHWDFGNGNTAIGAGQSTPGAVYTNPGNYTVSLRIEDNNGLGAPVTLGITVFDSPLADFNLSGPSEGCSPLNTGFVDASVAADAPINSWIWDFGDGNSSTSQNPSHIYFDQGVYNVALIVRDENNCQGDTTYNTIIRTGYPQDVDFVTAVPNNNTLTCTNMLTVDFEDQTTYLGTGPYSYLWDFGDGTTSTSQNTSHTYTAFGSYDVSLTVTDLFANCATTHTKTEFINLLNVVPSFTVAPPTGCQSQTVQFENTSNTLLGNQIVTWDFGDGNTLTGPATDANIMSPSHNYGVGVYTPSITVDINGGECTRTYTAPDPIIVKPFPTVDFVGDTLTSCQAPFNVEFTPNAPEAIQFNWDFGDGNTGFGQNPTHTYTADGSYTVSLRVTDSLGCQSTFTRNNYVNIQTPTALFTSDIFANAFLPATWDGRDINLVAGGCLPLDVAFTDLSTSITPIINWDWDFGDGNTATGIQNPTNTYLTAGEFSVSLTITTLDGCMVNYICDSCAVVGDTPDAQIDETNLPLQQCCVAEHDFINLTTPGTADYFWYEVSSGDFFGTDSTINNWNYFEQLPVNPNPQTLDFTFYAWSNGCVDTMIYPAFTTLHQPYVTPNMVVDPCIYSDSLRITAPTVLGLIDSISWDFTFNNQQRFGTTTPTFLSPETAGTYDLTVTSWDLTNIYNLSNGDTVCSCTVTESSYFPGLPIAYDFTSAVDSGCVPLSVQFDGPNENLAAWDWDFDNGFTSNIEDPVTVYDTIGNYNVTLIVTDVAGCRDTIVKSQFIEAIGANVYILPSQIAGCLPFAASYTDTSKTTAPIVSRTWEFGNGDQLTGNDSIVNYTFNDVLTPPALQKNGIDITLTTVDSNGCVNVGTTIVYIGDPEAQFNHEAFALCIEDSIVFTARENDTLGIVPFTFDWELDNPAPTTASGQLVSKKYEEGNYTVRLIVRDSLGCRDTSSFTNINVVTPQPNADFTTNRSVATCPPIVVTFGDSSTLGRAPITNWLWDFGDGSSSNIQHPTNIYSTENSFDVSLRVTDSLGCVDTTLIPGLVTLTGVLGGFQVFNEIVCESESATFIATSPNAARYIWDFGDGNIGLGDTIVHTYTFASTRFPSLVMQDSTGLCSRTFTDTVTVLPLPEVALGNDLELCDGEMERIGVFLDSTEIALWNTGATSDSITISVQDRYKVTVTNTATGCINSDSLDLTVFELPNVSTPGTKSVCEGGRTALTATSTDDMISYEWFEGGASFGTGDTIKNVLINGLRIFAVVAENTAGCTMSDTLFIFPVPPPVIEIADTAICIGDEAVISAVPENGTNAGERYEWYKDGILLTDSTNSSITVSEAFPYEVVYTVGECQTSEDFNVFHIQLPVLTPNEQVVFCSETESGVTISPGPYAAYEWEEDGSTSSTFRATEEGVYFVQVFNAFNCSQRDLISVIDLCPPRLFIGNAFTPNNDGNNDLFVPKADYVESFEMLIFNRWGEVIFHSNSLDHFWDGLYRGQEMPEGTYPWLINYTGTHPDYKGKIKEEGKVTLIR